MKQKRNPTVSEQLVLNSIPRSRVQSRYLNYFQVKSSENFFQITIQNCANSNYKNIPIQSAFVRLPKNNSPQTVLLRSQLFARKCMRFSSQRHGSVVTCAKDKFSDQTFRKRLLRAGFLRQHLCDN